jgi:signal transduction histidine kinase
MLIEFITTHRGELIARTRAKVAARSTPNSTPEELLTGVPLFLDQFVALLRDESASTRAAMDESATARGALLGHRGYTAAQVVHDYGDMCQAITELAFLLGATIGTEEFHTLNLCLDNAIAQAITEYIRIHDESKATGEVQRSGAFAHELRNKISAIQLAFLAIQSGRAPTHGSVAAVVTRTLHSMVGLVNRALIEVRLHSPGGIRRQRIALRALLADAGIEGAMEAEAFGVSFAVTPLDREAHVDADPQVLEGALANLLQNAFKFTLPGGHVSLAASVRGDRVEIDVTDACGGLPSAKEEALFGAFQQLGTNRTGLGLGLFLSRNGVAACGGKIRVRDRPGIGCVFTIELPLSPSPS